MRWYKWKWWRLAFSENACTALSEGKFKWKSLFGTKLMWRTYDKEKANQLVALAIKENCKPVSAGLGKSSYSMFAEDGLVQLHWQNPKNPSETIFVAQTVLKSGDEIMAKKKTTDSVAANVRRLRRKYVRVAKIGKKWNTYLQVDHQGFCVVEQTTKRRAEWFGKMLAIALARVN